LIHFFLQFFLLFFQFFFQFFLLFQLDYFFNDFLNDEQIKEMDMDYENFDIFNNLDENVFNNNLDENVYNNLNEDIEMVNKNKNNEKNEKMDNKLEFQVFKIENYIEKKSTKKNNIFTHFEKIILFLYLKINLNLIQTKIIFEIKNFGHFQCDTIGNEKKLDMSKKFKKTYPKLDQGNLLEVWT
jgi:hypothetical protein